ncbi:MAG: CHAT domain-containing protein [Phycisphaerae bacterium]
MSDTPAIGDLLEQLRSAQPGERASMLAKFGRINEVIIALADETQRLTFVDASKAIATSELVIALADQVGDARSRARARRTRSQALAYSGDFEAALTACREAAQIADSGGEVVEAARAKLASMHPLGEMGRYEDALAAGERARAELVAAGETLLAARADLNLGGVLQNRGEPARAMVHLDRAAAALANEPLALGHVQNNRGEALLVLNDFDGAQHAFEAALAAYELASANLAAAIVQGNLADLAARRGWLQRALAGFEHARRRLDADTATTHSARLLAEQAEALATLGLLHETLRTYDEVIPQLDSLGLAWESARARSGRGRCLIELGRTADAREPLEQAAAEFDRLDNAADRARVDLLRAVVALESRQFESARSLLRDAERDLPNRPLEQGVLSYQLARLAIALGNPGEAAEILGAAIAATAAVDIAPLAADLLHQRGVAYSQLRQMDAAVADLREAVRQVERVRGSLPADRFRAAFLGRRLAVYEDLLRAVLNRRAPGVASEAFRVVEQAKGRALLDLARGAIDLERDEGTSTDSNAALLTRLRQLRAELNALYNQLGASSSAKAAIAENWTAKVRSHEREIGELETRVASVRSAADLFAAPVALSDIQSRLAPDQALVEFFGVGDQLAAIVIRHDAATIIEPLAPIGDLTECLQRLQFQLSRAMRPGALAGERAARLTADAQRELARLYQLVLRPLLEKLDGARRCVIVPHGPLHGAPLHAAHDGQQYAIERFEFSYAPSASIWATVCDAAPRTARGALIVGVADPIAPRIEDEARALASIMPGAATLIGADATTDRVMLAASRHDTLHMACHGEFFADVPYASGLKLADRRLTLRDIYRMKLGARLVVLSACSSGRSLVQAGDELLGLSRAFFAAGTLSILATLWPVEDEVAMGLMSDFHTMVQRQTDGGSPAEALRTAQLRVLSDRPHPLLWAPFFLAGRP